MNVQSYKDKYGRYIKFIKKYREASNASTGSEVDSNANVDNKNVTTCTGELYKRDAIGINRLQMINKITELYGEDLASEYIRQLDSHEIYRHDETNPLLPYTYGSQEVVIVEYYGNIKIVSMERLYDMCIEPEILVDTENIVYNKKPNNMYIKDRNRWTKVINLFKKKRHKNLVRIKTEYGSIVVTEDHPVITSNDFENTTSANECIGENTLFFHMLGMGFDRKNFGCTLENETQYNAGKRMAKLAIEGSKEEKEFARRNIEDVFHWNNMYANGILDEVLETEHKVPRYLYYTALALASTNRPVKNTKWERIVGVVEATDRDNEVNDYIYDISTESHTFICNNFWVHNCVSITMYPYLFHGTTNIGGNSEAPKHLDSFCGSFINLVYAVASQFAGAIATPEFLMYMDYFIRKDYGDDYYLHPEQIVSMGLHPKSLENLIENKFQQVVYTINDPAGSRNFQSVE